MPALTSPWDRELLSLIRTEVVQYVPTTSLPCPHIFHRTCGVRTRCSACGGGYNSWYLCGPMVRSSHLLLGDLICYLLESCSAPVLEQVTVVCKSSDHCCWCHVLGGCHCNGFEDCLHSRKPMLCWRIAKIGNAFHNRIYVNSSFSIIGSNFYHLVGCSSFFVHTILLSSQKCIDVRSSALFQISRKCRDTALLKKKQNQQVWE